MWWQCIHQWAARLSWTSQETVEWQPSSLLTRVWVCVTCKLLSPRYQHAQLHQPLLSRTPTILSRRARAAPGASGEEGRQLQAGGTRRTSQCLAECVLRGVALRTSAYSWLPALALPLAMPTANEPAYDLLTKQLREVKPCILFKINTTLDYTTLLATQGLKRTCPHPRSGLMRSRCGRLHTRSAQQSPGVGMLPEPRHSSSTGCLCIPSLPSPDDTLAAWPTYTSIAIPGYMVLWVHGPHLGSLPLSLRISPPSRTAALLFSNQVSRYLHLLPPPVTSACSLQPESTWSTATC